jgi:hypothetical protein
MTQLPDALTAALREPAPRHAPAPPAVPSAWVQRGDLRFARGLPGKPLEPRLVLVLSVDSQLEFADVLLLHTATEMACEVDLVVPRSVSGVPYEVVVQTDLRGVVWTLQLGSAVGRLDDGAISALGRNATGPGSGAPTGLHWGLQMAGPADPRWGFKREEGAALRALSRDCTDALLDEGAWLVDPGLLRPDLLDLADDPASLVVELVHWVETRSLELSKAEIEVLLELGALDTDTWAAIGDLGLDIWTAIQDLVVDSATAADASSPDAGSHRLLTATHLEVYAGGAAPDFVHYLGRKEPAAT